MSGRKVVGAIRSLVNALSLMHGIKTLLCRENENSKIKAILMGNLRCLLCIRRRALMPNVWSEEEGG